MLNPCLFIMWDTAIADVHEVPKNPKGYVYEFMPTRAIEKRGRI
jgi:hypothetical protein